MHCLPFEKMVVDILGIKLYFKVAIPPSARKVDASPFRSPRGLDGAEQCIDTARRSRRI